MSVSAPATRPMLIAEYLEREFLAQTKSEFWDGELISMAGASEPHSRIQMNIVGLVLSKLQGTPCRLYGSDLRVRLQNRPRYRYPDLMILCGKPEFDEADARKMSVINPRVIVEILSESTESEDRGRKFDDYRSIPSFEEYVMVAQDSGRVESWWRQPDGNWKISVWIGLETAARIESLAIELPMKRVYEDVELPSTPPPEAVK